MGAITPDARTATSTAVVVPHEGWVYDSSVSSVQVSTHALRHRAWYFVVNAVDNSKKWTSNISGLVCCAWQDENPASAKGVTVEWTRAGVITFWAGDDDHEGWVHTWSTGA